MAEWSIAAVLKTVEPRGSWGSNPYFSAKIIKAKHIAWLFLFLERQKQAFVSEAEKSSPLIPLQRGRSTNLALAKAVFGDLLNLANAKIRINSN